MNKVEPEDGAHTVIIEPKGWEFACSPGQTLLLAALQAGITLPHSCRNGSCRACMAQLIEGRISYRIEWPGLLREEQAEGWILPCVAEPRSRLRLAAPQAQRQPAPSSSPAAVDKSVHSLPTAAASD
jgi:ferredoxin